MTKKTKKLPAKSSPTPSKDLSRLRQIEIFSDLNKEDLAKLLKIVSWRRVTSGSEIFQEGDLGNTAFLIEKGRVLITKKDKNKSSQEIAILSDGDFFGEMSLLENKPRSATAQTLQDSLLIEIHAQELFAWAFKDPKSAIGIGLKLVRALSERLRETTQQLTGLRNLTSDLLSAHNTEAAFQSAAQEFTRILTADIAGGAILYSFNPYLEEFVALEHWGDIASDLLVSRKELPQENDLYRIFPIGEKNRQGCLLINNVNERRFMKISPLLKTFTEILNQALLNIETRHEQQLQHRLKNRSIIT